MHDLRDRPRRSLLLLDRSAVLVAGLVTGFVVGASFRAPTYVGAGPPSRASDVRTADTQPRPKVPPAVASLDRSPIDPLVLARVRRDGRIRVGVFGDSFGNGVWDALYRQLPRSEGYDVLRFSKEATGFSRYGTLDLEARAKEQLSQEPVDVAVISFGANDARDIYAEDRLLPLMSEGWRRIIGERLDRFVATARSTGATVYWIGLPVMRDAQMDATMQAMDAFYARHMSILGVSFVDTRPLSVDAQGRYSAYLPDARTGRPLLMRTGDGVHMMGVGYQRLTADVAQRIRMLAARAREAAGASTPSSREDGE